MLYGFLQLGFSANVRLGSKWLAAMNTLGREPKNCLGRVFNFKLGCFVDKDVPKLVGEWPHLELKTRPRILPVS